MHRHRRIAFLLALAAALPATARAQEPGLDGPVFETLAVSGPGPSGKIAALGVDRIEIDPGDGSRKAFATTDLIRLRRDAAADLGDGAYVALPGGDRIARARIGAATDAAVEVESTGIGKGSVPLDALLGLVLDPPTDVDALDALIRRLRTEPRTSEIAWLANGDRVAGSFLGMDARAVKLQGPDGPRELDRAGVRAIGFDPGLTSYPAPEGPYLEVGLIDGSRLGLTDVRLDRGRVTGVTRFGSRFDAPISDVTLVACRTPAVSYLSDRPADGKSYVPYLDLVRPFQVDATVEGRPMILGSRPYERGFGTSSRTLLAFKLQPGDLRFQATVGVDERAGPLGSVVFRVLADGKERYASPAMTHRDAPADVDVDLEGVKLLILATEFGDRGDVRDLADWADARIIRHP